MRYINPIERTKNLNIQETETMAAEGTVEMDDFNALLKQKIRQEFHEQLPEKYWNLIDGVENPSDDREILCKLALDAGIPVIININEKNSKKSYDIGILWNEMPKLVGVSDIVTLNDAVFTEVDLGKFNAKNPKEVEEIFERVIQKIEEMKAIDDSKNVSKRCGMSKFLTSVTSVVINIKACE